MPSTVVRRFLPLLLVALTFAAACGGDNPYQATSSQPTPAELVPTVASNDLLPTRANVSDCIGAVERPNCGSEAKGGWQLYLTFAVLIAGMSFIGWRVVRGVRARDNVVVEQ